VRWQPAYSQQQRAAECRFQQAREEGLAPIARTPALPELLAIMKDEVNLFPFC